MGVVAVRGGDVVARHLARTPTDEGAGRGGRRHRGRRRGGAVPIVAALVLLALGGTLLLLPSIQAVQDQLRVEKTVAQSREDGDPAGDVAEGGADKEDDPTYQALLTYSEEVRAGTGDAVNDPFAFSGDELAELGLPDGIVGSVDIPKMGVTLPLYLGATPENLARGAAVIAGTSMPVGGTSSNCVIAAHRGVWSGLQMFRDIELLEVGDTLTITTRWDTLTYRVFQTRAISPDDVDALAVQEGRDLVTLFTCHPYGQHTQRYLVYCERVDNDEAQKSAGVVERAVRAYLPAASEESPSLTVELVLRAAGLMALAAVSIALIVVLARRVSEGR